MSWTSKKRELVAAQMAADALAVVEEFVPGGISPDEVPEIARRVRAAADAEDLHLLRLADEAA
jgi:hypothetical protein